MAAAVVLVLVAGDAVVEGDFAGEAALGEQLQGAVDGGVADLGVFLFDQAVELVGGEVLAGCKEGLQDGVALGGVLEADALEVLVQDALGFADHLGGDGRLVVDAFVQSGQWDAELLSGPWPRKSPLEESGYHRVILKMKFKMGGWLMAGGRATRGPLRLRSGQALDFARDDGVFGVVSGTLSDI